MQSSRRRTSSPTVDRSYQSGVDTALSWAYAALIGGFAVSWVVLATAARGEMGIELRSAIAALVVLALVTGWRGARGRLGDADVRAAVVVAVALQWAWLMAPHVAVSPGQRCMVTTAVIFGAFAFGAADLRAATTFLAGGAQLAADWVAVGLVAAVGGLWPVVAAGIAVSAVVPALRAAADRADVVRAPGRGTGARLALRSAIPPVRQAPSRHERLAAALGDIRRPLALACLPYLAMSAVFAGWYALAGGLPWWVFAWFGGLAVLTAVALARAHTGLSGAVVAAALTYAVLGAVASLWVLPVDSLHTYESWPLGAVTALLAIVVLVRPPWEAGLAMAVQQVAIAVAALVGRFGPGTWTDRLAEATPAALSTVTPVMLGAVIGLAILRLGAAVTQANADSGAQPAPDGRRHHARALGRAARDELQLPGVLDATARELLRRARADGCAVTFQTGGLEITAPTLVRDLLVAALASGATPRELVLSVGGTGADGGTHARVTVVVVPGDPDRAAALTREFGARLTVLDAAAEVTWVEVRAEKNGCDLPELVR